MEDSDFSGGKRREMVGSCKHFSWFSSFFSCIGFPQGLRGGGFNLVWDRQMILCGCDRCNSTSGSIKASKQFDAREISRG